MTLEYIKGDLIELFKKGEFDAIGHQCNLVSGRYVAGLAASMFKEFPILADIAEQDTYNTQLFGKVNSVYQTINDKTHTIFNMYAQYYTGSPQDKYITSKCVDNGFLIKDDKDTRYRALYSCLKEIKNFNYKRIGFPLLASDLAKPKGYEQFTTLDYFEYKIEPIIKTAFEETFTDIKIIIFDK